MKFGVVRFPGANCEQDAVHALRHLGFEADYIWHEENSVKGFDALVLPGGFSYGDYLRCGAIARFSPIMTSIAKEAQAGLPVIGICNGFQVLTEAHLLPGALIRNKNMKFICKSVSLRVEDSVCKWIDYEPQTRVHIPIAHGEGNYVCDDKTYNELVANKQIVVRYADGAPNGSRDYIAGICNKEGNIFGLMPHPERVSDKVSGSDQGAAFFLGIAKYLQERR